MKTVTSFATLKIKQKYFTELIFWCQIANITFKKPKKTPKLYLTLLDVAIQTFPVDPVELYHILSVTTPERLAGGFCPL